MAQVAINVPGFKTLDGETPIVILGPNGSGKTKLAQKIAREQLVCAISAQRRTWVDDSLPVQNEKDLRQHTRSQQDRWQEYSWHPTEDLHLILSQLIQDHTNRLTINNEEAIASTNPLQPVRDSKLMLLQALWGRLFPKRKLEIGGFFPKVKRLDGPEDEVPYQLRQMSDGERTILYMAARVITAEQNAILVDEPELHMHSRISIKFWDEAEKMRPDCRFLYVTHDLNFALSRRRATVLVARSDDAAEPILVDQLPTSVASEVLGAATLPFYAKRIFIYEGEPGNGFASEFFSAWFDDVDTFAIPSGNRDSVCAAVSGLKTVGVVAAEVVGLIDRDFYSDEVLNSVPAGVTVLELHEIESVLCGRDLVKALAAYQGKQPEVVWQDFLNEVRKKFKGQTLNAVIANRVRSRVGDLLDGAFGRAQIDTDFELTSKNHQNTLITLDLPIRVDAMFKEESNRVLAALAGDGNDLLKIFPGKHLLSILGEVLGFRNTKELPGLVIRLLASNRFQREDSMQTISRQLETALQAYLPPRKAS